MTQSGCHCRTWVDNLTGNRLWAHDVGGPAVIVTLIENAVGGAGNDTLTGSTGTDRFDFNALAELGLTSTTRDDTITDFKTSEADTALEFAIVLTGVTSLSVADLVL